MKGKVHRPLVLQSSCLFWNIGLHTWVLKYRHPIGPESCTWVPFWGGLVLASYFPVLGQRVCFLEFPCGGVLSSVICTESVTLFWLWDVPKVRGFPGHFKCSPMVKDAKLEVRKASGFWCLGSHSAFLIDIFITLRSIGTLWKRKRLTVILDAAAAVTPWSFAFLLVVVNDDVLAVVPVVF